MGFVRPIPETSLLDSSDNLSLLILAIIIPAMIGLGALVGNTSPPLPPPEIRSTERGTEFKVYHHYKLGFKSRTYIDQNRDGRLDYRLDSEGNRIFVDGGINQYLYRKEFTEWNKEEE